MTYSFKIPMNHITGMEVAEALSDVGIAGNRSKLGSNAAKGAPTSPTRSTLEFFSIYSCTSAPDIQSEMSWRGVIVIPNRGTMF